jgi:hypothetical protein
MSITFPIAMPSAPGFQKFNLVAENIVGVSKSPFTLQAQTYQWPGECWTLDATLPPMHIDQAQAWVTFLVSLRGRLGTFYVGDEANASPAGVATGTPLVNGAQSAMSSTLATKGWTTNTTGILKAGDYIQLGTGASQRLYKVLADANSDSSGHAALDIFPRLREGVSDSQAITIAACKGTFRLIANNRQWSVDEARMYGIDLKCEEAI